MEINDIWVKIVTMRGSAKMCIDNNWRITKNWMNSYTRKHDRWTHAGARSNITMEIKDSWVKIANMRNSVKMCIDSNWRIKGNWMISLTM